MTTHGATAGAAPDGQVPAERIRAARIERELELAREVQRAIFPSPLPTLRGMQLAAVNRPARFVSGDLYDVIVIDPERTVILCADVSGKGFAAALMASGLSSYVRATLRAACVFADTSLGPLPIQVVALLNDQIARHQPSDQYATMFFAEFDTSDRSLRYVNAGQNAPLVITRGSGAVAELTAGGPPIGLLQDASYDVGSLSLGEDDTVLIYTDGVVEARSPADEEFGLDRLIDICRREHADVRALVAAVLNSVRTWSRGREQGDDITLVALAASQEE